MVVLRQRCLRAESLEERDVGEEIDQPDESDGYKSTDNANYDRERSCDQDASITVEIGKMICVSAFVHAIVFPVSGCLPASYNDLDDDQRLSNVVEIKRF